MTGPPSTARLGRFIVPLVILLTLVSVAAWFALRRVGAHGAIDEEYDVIGVVVAAAVLIALPLFVPTAVFVACLVGGAVGGLAGLAASALYSSDN